MQWVNYSVCRQRSIAAHGDANRPILRALTIISQVYLGHFQNFLMLSFSTHRDLSLYIVCIKCKCWRESARELVIKLPHPLTHGPSTGAARRSPESSRLAALRKVHHMASDKQQLTLSALAKLREFAELRYPVGIRRFMCAIMARDTSDLTWRTIRTEQSCL